MRLLVCGGRDFHNHVEMDRFLRMVHEKRGIDVLINGGATGADAMAAAWAERWGIPVETYKADWSLGKKAGPMRNRCMLVEGKPDGVAAFFGGKGTADMVKAAREAGIPVAFPGWKGP